MGNKKLFLCSFGGKILARPRDRKLRYVGGETRIIQICNDASWEELNQALMRMYGQPHTIQYQVPGLGEDFHCLLSVSSDDELEDLMEYGVAYEGGSEKLIRIFLFPLDDDVDAHLSLTSEGDSRTHYLSAVNGLILENKASKGFHSEPSDARARAELLHRLSKVEAASRLDGSDNYSAPKTQTSSPAALEDGLIEFEKDGEPANSAAKSKSNAQNPSSKVEESLGEATSENLESGIEENEGLIIDSAVGKIDLGNMKELDSDDIVELRELGSGGFGIVYHGSWKGRDVAIKRIKANSFGGQQSGQYRVILESLREAGILSTLHHQNIVSLYGFVLDEPRATVAIVTELVVDGSLRNILFRDNKYLDYRKRLIIAKGAAFGMEYLHLKKIVHFDLKCDNLLVDLKDPDQPICKVTDFGLSKVKQNSLVSAGIRGTLPWMAPELLKGGGKSMVSEKVDVFSFGIVMWEILTGKVPYGDMNEGEILGGRFADTLRPPVPESCDPAWRRLMEQCWTSNPKERPSFTQIANRLHLMSLTSHAEGGE